MAQSPRRKKFLGTERGEVRENLMSKGGNAGWMPLAIVFAEGIFLSRAAPDTWGDAAWTINGKR